MMLRCGIGCTMDKQRAMVTFQQSAAQGHAGSMSCLGTLHYSLLFIFQFLLYFLYSIFFVYLFSANMHESGEGCSIDKFRAFDLYRKAKAGIAKENDGTAVTRMWS